jgi:hypothetical protein
MGDTSMIPGSGTQSSSAFEMKKVETTSGGYTVQTDYSARLGNMHAVRVSRSDKTVTLRVNTERMREQARIKEMNDSIRKRTRG